jgi:dihydroorotate dehydrogenase electron transfer subunit
VGIAPLLFFARLLGERGVRPVALYGGRTHRDLPLEDDLSEVTELHLVTEDGTRGSKGRVTDILGELLVDGVDVFTCGPDRMMAAVAAMCEAHDLPCEASLETPMACGYGVCLGCPVPTQDGSYLYACTQGPCVDTRRIAWGRGEHAPHKQPDRRSVRP